VLLAAGTKTYRHGADFAEPLADLDGIPEALGWVVETLTDLGYQPAGADRYLLDPSLQRLRQAVRAAAGAAPVVIVYYTGHGMKPDRSLYYLVTAAARPDDLEGTALEARQLLGLVWRRDAHGNELPDEEQPQVLVILDCCFAGAGGMETLKDLLQGIGNPKVWVLATASSVEWAQQGRFAAALKQALLDPEAGPSQEYLGLESILGNINAALGGAGHQVSCFSPPGGLTGWTPFFPNPKYVPNVAGLTVAEQHWVSRLRGAPADTTTAGFYVTGRTGRLRVVEDLAAWMGAPDGGGLAMVTGSPGCGKSTMLALPVLLTDPQRRDALVARAAPDSLVARAASLFDGLPVLGVHARGMNPYQAAAAIAQPLGRSADNPEDLLKDLDDRPETAPRIVVVDAVDEARDPQRLLTDLLVPLARRLGLWVVVGARRHIRPPAAETSLLVELDSDKYRDRRALADYAHQLLVAAHEPDVFTPYQGRDDDTAATVAEAIADRATAQPIAAGQQEQQESFLLAQLLARAVRGRQDVLDITGADWADRLPTGVGAAFDADLRGLGGRESVARVLLAALAWAKGPGLPWERIWVPVAQALAAETGVGAVRLNRDDVRWLLDNAGAYVVEDVGPGQRSVFRPFHDLVAAHLRGQPDDEQIATDRAVRAAWQLQRQQVEQDVTRALLDSRPTASDGEPDWQLAHPYVRTYLAQHAHAAGPDIFARLAADLDFLAVADPAILTPLLTPTDPTLREVARSYRRARPLLGQSARDNAAYLQEATVAETGSHPTSQRIRPTYRTLMARVRRDNSLLTLSGHTNEVTAVAFGAGADGRPLLASASRDRTVRLWDPATGDPVGDPLRGHTGRVTAAAFGVGADSRPLLASATYDGRVRLWDPTSGDPVGDPLQHTGWVTAVAFGVGADGRPLLASASHDETVRLWDPTTGTPLGDPLGGPPRSLTGLTHQVTAVAFGAGADGRPLLASTSHDAVRLWDPTTGTPVGDRLLGHIGRVTAAAFGAGADGRPLLASAGVDGAVRLWDPTTGTSLGHPLWGHAGRVTAVAFGVGAGGRPLLASAGRLWGVRLWDPTTGTFLGDPLEDPPRTLFAGVTAVAFGAGADGRLLLASASDDGTVQLWDPATGTLVVTLLRRTTPAAVATHNTQLAIADAEGITVIEVMETAG
jgi:WD40 repeat protein